MELSHHSAISRVVIYPPKLTLGRIEAMNGFAVEILLLAAMQYVESHGNQVMSA